MLISQFEERMASKKRKWNDDYVQFGFTCTKQDGTDKPQCMLCNIVMCNANLKPANLCKHIESQHGATHGHTSIDQFKIKRIRFDGKATLPARGFVPIDKPLLEASYRVAYRIAKNKKTHTIGEDLIKPCAMEMAKIVLGKEAERKLSLIPCSNDVVSSRIGDMSEDIVSQVVSEIKASPTTFSMQLDESTDVANCSQLLVFVRYVFKRDLKEEFLFCEALETTTRAVDVFNKVAEFFEKHGITWMMVGSVCTDGAPAMLGARSGFVALVKQRAPHHVIVTHCVLHRHALASKTLPRTLHNVMDIIVKVVNFIRGRALNHRVFKAFCEEVGSEHQVLLFHTNVRWLSRGRVTTRVFELRQEIAEFLRHQECELASHFDDDDFIVHLAYLADTFSHLNELNVSMQGAGMTIVKAKEKLTAFTRKLDLWKRRMEVGNFANFPALDVLAVEGNYTEFDVAAMVTHLGQLSASFDGYFPENQNSEFEEWIFNPFVSNMDDNDAQKEALIDMQEDGSAKAKFEKMEIAKFWCDATEGYPELAVRALKHVMPFVTTYLCESGFSAVVTLKTKT